MSMDSLELRCDWSDRGSSDSALTLKVTTLRFSLNNLLMNSSTCFAGQEFVHRGREFDGISA